MKVPEQLLNELRGIKGFDEARFMEAHQHAAITSVRLHPLKNSQAFTGTEQVPWCAGGRYLNERPVFTLDPLYHAGAYYVQEASSMFLEYLLKQLLPGRDNLRVLDLCAAPGGKSTLLASLIGEQSLLVSNEVIRTRAPILEENVVRWGYTNNWVCSNDPRDFVRLPGYFDVMVVDAPCSGSGLFRKDEGALKEWSEGNVALCGQRQQRILADAWPALKEGGILLYATCSYSPQEDEAILDWLVETYGVQSMRCDVPQEWGIVETTSSRGATGYRFFPDKVKGEGFFIAAVQKTNEERTMRPGKNRSLNDKKIQAQAGYLLQEGSFIFFQQGREVNCAINQGHEADWYLLNNALYLRKVGATLGMPGAKEWVPAHDIALSTDRSMELPTLELSGTQALQFMKKEEMSCEPVPKGWCLITFEGLGLGWVKSLGNRFNNYLPKHWRIRMEIPGTDQA